MVQSENKEQSQLLGSTVLVFFFVLSFSSHCRLNFVLCFLFLEREDIVLSQHWFGNVPKAQSVLHCHCVFKLFKIKTVLWGMKKQNVMTLRQAMRCSFHEALKSGQPPVRNEVLTSIWLSLQADPLPQLSLQITAVPSQLLNCNPMRDHPEFLTQKLWDDTNVRCFSC